MKKWNVDKIAIDRIIDKNSLSDAVTEGSSWEVVEDITVTSHQTMFFKREEDLVDARQDVRGSAMVCPQGSEDAALCNLLCPFLSLGEDPGKRLILVLTCAPAKRVLVAKTWTDQRKRVPKAEDKVRVIEMKPKEEREAE